MRVTDSLGATGALFKFAIALYTGGRIPPIFYGKRPNKVGYLLLLTGSATLIMAGLALWAAFAAATLLDGSRPLLISIIIGLL